MEKKKEKSELSLLEEYKKWLVKIKKYMEEYSIEKDWWNWLENVEFATHRDVVENYPFNSEFLDRLVKTNKVDLDKTEDYTWEEWFKPIWFWNYLEDLFWDNDDYRIMFLIDVLK